MTHFEESIWLTDKIPIQQLQWLSSDVLLTYNWV